ncbi:hydroxylase/desaturase CTB9 [Triangularia setosa]|uniref:Hydroxylase/desaturase CTB9 n=1 Tax=Triangularia setosa TaxID=2587417 RepID=A0AAN6W740_9PEZI|nr:hydroxylase/desaturase CTB9 [Podospora setosa]
MLTSLRFLIDLELFKKEVPFEIFGYPYPTSERITNCEYEIINEIEIQDVRVSPAECSLDTTGFTYIHHKSACELRKEHFEKVGSSLEDNPTVVAYLNESMRLVKDRLGAEKVICFDWRFRRTGAPPGAVLPVDDTHEIRLQALAPGYDMHCDFSHRGGWQRLEKHLIPEEREAVASGRLTARIINTWRPLSVVKTAPLVIMDRRTVLQDDLIEVEKVLPDKIERGYYVKYQSYHKYFYMSDQGPENVALFTTWDIKQGDRTAEIPPHGAASFFANDCLDNPRESVEMRLIVLTKE